MAEEFEFEFDLKNDCLIEILIRLPVKSLIRFTCVSKAWLSLIRSPEFIAKHYEFHHHNSDNHSLLALFTPGCSISLFSGRETLIFETAFKFRPAVVYDPPLYQIYHRDVIAEHKIHGPCNGLFLISFVKGSSYDNHVLLLWNPATREVFRVPDIDNNHGFTRCLDYGFGFDTVNLDYKVVGLYAYINGVIDDTIVCLYSLATNTWTRLYHAYDHISTQLDVSNNIKPASYSTSPVINGICCQYGVAYRIRAPCSPNGSSSNGRMHNWIAEHDPGFRHLLLSFDMVDEAFVQTPLPPGVSGGVGFLSHGSEYPCVFSFRDFGDANQHLHIWGLQAYGPTGVWNKLLDITVPESQWRTTLYAAVLWNSNQFVFSPDGTLMSFNLTTKQMTSFGIPGNADIIAYTESLVPIAKSVRQQLPIIHHSHHFDQQKQDDDDDSDGSSSSSSSDSAFLTPDITPFFEFNTLYIDEETDREFHPRRLNEIDRLSKLPYCLCEVNHPMVSNPFTF